MSKTYEERLATEFGLLQKLQNYPGMKDVITIHYMPRREAGKWVPITTPVPSGSQYPEVFKVRYKMPMYVCPKGKLKKDWQSTVRINVTEEALLGNDNLGVEVVGTNFPADSIPFNKHVKQGWICTGDLWSRTAKPRVKDNYYGGIYHFVVAIGQLFNLDKDVINPIGDHLNAEASAFYENTRHYQSTNDINWPKDLSVYGFTIKQAPITKPKFTIKPLK